MKKLVSRIRNKRLKGNVSLLVIFILLASSVISLLSINQIQRLITYGNMTFNYFRAFYIAKAGTELGLTEVYNRGDGFNHSINSGDSIIQSNLVGIYTGFDPYFNMTITGSFSLLTNDIRYTDECRGNEIELAPNAGIMLSLFSDTTKGINDILSDNSKDFSFLNADAIRSLRLDSKDNGRNLTFAFFTYKPHKDEETGKIDYYMDDIVVKNEQAPNEFNDFLDDPDVARLLNDKASNTKKYITIKNGGGNSVNFCISRGGNDIPYSNSIITVFGHYGDMEVGLESIVKKGIPDWTLNVIGQPTPGSS